MRIAEGYVSNACVAQLVEQLICNPSELLILNMKYKRSTDKVERFLYILRTCETALLRRLSKIKQSISPTYPS